MITILDSIINVPIHGSSRRVDIMPKNGVVLIKVPFSDMISTFPLEPWTGTSMMLSKNVMLVYYKVSEPSKSVGTCILIVKLCT